jgi:hypothetical protein
MRQASLDRTVKYWLPAVFLGGTAVTTTIYHLTTPLPAAFTAPGLIVFDLFIVLLALPLLHHSRRTLGGALGLLFFFTAVIFMGGQESLWILLGKLRLHHRFSLVFLRPVQCLPGLVHGVLLQLSSGPLGVARVSVAAGRGPERIDRGEHRPLAGSGGDQPRPGIATAQSLELGRDRRADAVNIAAPRGGGLERSAARCYVFYRPEFWGAGVPRPAAAIPDTDTEEIA